MKKKKKKTYVSEAKQLRGPDLKTFYAILK